MVGPSEVIRGHLRSSEVVRGHPRSSPDTLHQQRGGEPSEVVPRYFGAGSESLTMSSTSSWVPWIESFVLAYREGITNVLFP